MGIPGSLAFFQRDLGPVLLVDMNASCSYGLASVTTASWAKDIIITMVVAAKCTPWLIEGRYGVVMMI